MRPNQVLIAPFLLCTTRGCRYEAHLSTLRSPPQAYAWLPGPHGNARWPRSYPCSPSQRSSASRRLAEKPTTVHRLLARQGFPRCSRLLKAPDFSRVFERRQVRRGRYFTLHWRPRGADEQPEPSADRLGVVIAKRLLKTAVHRNLLKRLCREAFRIRPRANHPKVYLDIVVRLAVKLDASTASRQRKALAGDIAALFNAITSKTART